MATYLVDKNKVITMVRGDSEVFKFKFTEGKFPFDSPLKVNDGDVIFFGLMDPHQHFEYALLKKEYSNKDFDEEGNFILTLNPDDTIELAEGTYFYSIKLLRTNAEIKTLVQKTRFHLVS